MHAQQPPFLISQLFLQFFHILFRQEGPDQAQVVFRFFFPAGFVAGLGSPGGQPEDFRIGAQGDGFLLGEGGQFFPGGRFPVQLLVFRQGLELFFGFFRILEVQAQEIGVPGSLQSSLWSSRAPWFR